MGEFDCDNPIGLAYDSRTDSLWIMTNSSLDNINKKTGSVIRSIKIALNAQDQIYIDEEKDIIYFTVGNNYNGRNYVYSVNLTNDVIRKEYTLKDSYAVERIYIDYEDLYILNDGVYHNAKNATNQVNIYKLPDNKNN